MKTDVNYILTKWIGKRAKPNDRRLINDDIMQILFKNKLISKKPKNILSKVETTARQAASQGI